jgi:hypothetical protein
MGKENFMVVNAFLVLDFERFLPHVPLDVLRTRIAAMIERFSAAQFPLGVEELLRRVQPATGWDSLEKVWSALAAFEVFSGRQLEISGSMLAWGDEKHDGVEQQAREAYLRETPTPETEQGVKESPLDMSRKTAKLLRKRESAPKWAIALARLVEKGLGQQGEGMETEGKVESGGWVAAEDLWKLLLRHDKQGKEYLVTREKRDKKKERARRKKADKKERRLAKGKKTSYLSSSEESDSSRSTSSSSSSSSSDQKPSKSSKSSYKGSYSQADQSDTPNSSTHGKKPEFVYIGGKPHFRTRKGGKLVDCSKPPSTTCSFCPNKHWHWEAEKFGCPGPQRS